MMPSSSLLNTLSNDFNFDVATQPDQTFVMEKSGKTIHPVKKLSFHFRHRHRIGDVICNMKYGKEEFTYGGMTRFHALSQFCEIDFKYAYNKDDKYFRLLGIAKRII